MRSTVIGVDIGGTHITSCVVDIATAAVMEDTRIRGDIDPLQNREQVIRSWADNIAACAGRSGNLVQRIGIAMPGPFDYEQGISFISGLHKYECLYGVNVKELLAAALQIPAANIRMMNDATAFLAGETKSWAGRDCKHVVGITLGTGLGSAMYLDGCFEDGDLWNFPFRDSRAEEYLSSRWFTAAYRQRTGHNIKGVKELVVKAMEDTMVADIFKDFGYTLAEVLIKRFSKKFPRRIVVGGNISKAWNLFQPHASAQLQENGFVCELLPARLGEDAALVGAACLWE
ncbi:MAG: ROK family protein [Chitinophagaceae bacterium]|nr:ROK family protein [Chitinophagaceae bacterium]